MNNIFNLICLDIDGTLINDNKEIPNFTLQELKRIYCLGVKVVFVSSRMPMSLIKIMDSLSFQGPVISYNGALIYQKNQENETENILYSNPLSVETPKIVFEKINEKIKNIHFGVFYNDNWYVNEIDYWSLREIRGTKVWPQQVNLKIIINELYTQDKRVHKVVLRSQKQILDEVEKILNSIELKSDVIFRPNDTYLEIIPEGVSKAKAIKVIQKYYGITNAKTIAFGDNINDLEMIKYVGHGVAMGNSVPELTKQANEITLTNNEDGVGYILRKYFPHDDEFFNQIKL